MAVETITPLHLRARLSRRSVPPRCVEKLGFNAVRYVQCQRQPGHPSKCWSEGWSWCPAGDDQARRYEPSEAAPRDVLASWTPQRQRPAKRAQRPAPAVSVVQDGVSPGRSGTRSPVRVGPGWWKRERHPGK